jgi:hypothetical protein
VTIREWLATRSLAAPAPLQDRMLELIGSGAELSADRGADVFLETAQKSLAALLSEQKFDRDGALDLLAIDALMTFAYEHAAEHAATAASLDALTHRGVELMKPLVPSHG